MKPTKPDPEDWYPRVVFLCSKPSLGQAPLAFLQTLRCRVVHKTMTDAKVLCYPAEYDIGLNYLGTRRIPANQVNKPRLGWVNFHPAPLPEYGGRNLCYQAIADGAKWFGATMHYMDEQFDTGALIDVRRFLIEPQHTAGELYSMSCALLEQMFFHWVLRLLEDRAPATPQNGTTVYHKRQSIEDSVQLTPEQEQAIRARTFAPNHYARVTVGGRRYKVVPEELT